MTTKLTIRTKLAAALALPLAALAALAGFQVRDALEAREAATAQADRARAVVEAGGSLDATTATDLDDSELRTGAELVDALRRQRALESEIDSTVVTAGPGAAELMALARLHEAGDARIRALAVPPFATIVAPVLEQVDRVEYANALQATGTGAPATVPVAPAGAADLRLAESGVAVRVAERAEALRDAAVSQVQWNLLLAAASVLLAILVIVLANLWITRPLRRLAGEANQMAQSGLPDAVRAIFDEDADAAEIEVTPVRTRGGAEITGVVDALNAVQASALQLADEQSMLRRGIADSFVNLGRRNQHLIARQLDVITELEQGEPDAERLAQLFTLDHLATRMRRNAESLLVLAGEHPPRQWHAPVPVLDVVRAASGEVEQYRRVDVQALEDVSVAGAAVADVSHLVAELLENALSFSSPETAVEVYGRHCDAGYTLTLVDHGIGMPEEAIAAANERLASDVPFTVTPARYLGHYVVARLAARHGIDVGLTHTPGGGTSAVVVLPAALLEDLALRAPEPPVWLAPATIEPDAVEPDAVAPGEWETGGVAPSAWETDGVAPSAGEPEAPVPDVVEPAAFEMAAPAFIEPPAPTTAELPPVAYELPPVPDESVPPFAPPEPVAFESPPVLTEPVSPFAPHAPVPDGPVPSLMDFAAAIASVEEAPFELAPAEPYEELRDLPATPPIAVGHVDAWMDGAPAVFDPEPAHADDPGAGVVFGEDDLLPQAGRRRVRPAGLVDGEPAASPRLPRRRRGATAAAVSAPSPAPVAPPPAAAEPDPAHVPSPAATGMALFAAFRAGTDLGRAAAHDAAHDASAPAGAAPGPEGSNG